MHAPIDLKAGYRPAGGTTLACFGLCLFASAFLLFAMEPLVSRMVLPRLGGSPAVWNTCVCFFQAALLIGYGYAHIAAARLRLTAQVVLHAAALVAAMAYLPLSLGEAAPPANTMPVGWLLLLLIRSIGLPFIAIAATAPLLQAWFARTTHLHARDPYFLYAASNAGSLLSLLAYPFLIEPAFGLGEQATYWSIGFAATAWLMVLCGLLARRSIAATADIPAHVAAVAEPVPAREKLRWLLLSAVPSGLMLAVTTHITTDIASAPLFWVLPLALYILTFVIAFARHQHMSVRGLGWVQAVGIVAAAAVSLRPDLGTLPALLVPLLAFAATAMACHLELAHRRPDPAHLTGYFMLISLGGAIGGWFCGLLAPMLFRVPLEYPILLVAACLLRPAQVPSDPALRGRALRFDIALPFLVPVAIIGVLRLSAPSMPAWLHPVGPVAILIVPSLLMLWMAGRPLRFALALAFALALPLLLVPAETSARSFFGVFRVRTDPAAGIVKLQHGTTLHGVENIAEADRDEPLSYYHRQGPFGRLFATLRANSARLDDVGLVGLGTGALSCYARPGERWSFREIDPLAETLARDTRWFHFMADCPAHAPVILGDARVTLTADTAARYDLLVIDAFSSDSVPVHLITREALRLYLRHLRPGGLIAFHVSNRYLNLVPVVARLAADAGMPALHLKTEAGSDPLRQPATEVVLIGKPDAPFEALRRDGWDVPEPGPVLWTDDRSDIVRVIRW